MNEVITKEMKEEKYIEDMIYEIRGTQVMLDSDVAKLYQVETRIVNQVIKRNLTRFPETFCFQLTMKEIEELSLRSQFATLNIHNNKRGQHYKYLPYVLTEQGIMMLSGLLKSDIAVKVNIQIIDAFVKMRRFLSNGLLNSDREMLIRHDNDIKLLKDTVYEMNKKQKINTIFYDGEVYDAYSLLMELLGSAEKEIILIDNYVNKELLDILRNTKKKIFIVSKETDRVLKEKYQSQYENIIFFQNDTFHDRFIILDRKKLYSCGSSFKDLGKKCFAINEMNSEEILQGLLKKLEIEQVSF